MRLIRGLLLSLILICLVQAGTLNAEVLTLEDCINMALESHPDVVRADGNFKTASADLWNAAGQFLPSVNASASVSENWGNRLDENSGLVYDTWQKSYSAGIGASMTVFDGGRMFFNYFASKANKAYYKYQAEGTRQNLVFSVKTSYFAYLAAQKILEIRTEALKRGEEQLKLAESRFEVGSASKSDVLKARVQYGNDRLNLFEAENNVKTAMADLAYIIGANVNSDIQVSTAFKAQQYEGSESDALAYGMEHQPGFLSAQKDLGISKLDLWSAYALYLPSIDVRVSRGYGNTRWTELKSFKDTDGSWSISTSLNIPIFQQFFRKRAVTRAKANLNDSRAAFYYAKNNLALEIKKAYLDMNNAREKLSVAEETVLSAQEDMDLVQEKYNLGAATILELLDAQVSLITAENDKVQAEFDFNLAVSSLENAMGIR